MLAAAGTAVAYALLAAGNAADRLSFQDPRAGNFVPQLLRANSEQVLARDVLAQGNAAAAVGHAARAVDASPLEAGAIGLLGAANLASGEPHAAFAAMRFGQALGWRDAAVQAYLFEQAMGAGDAPRAALHVDALLRTRPGDAGIRSAIDRVLALDGGEAAMLERLRYKPRWRSAVLGELDGLESSALQRRARLVGNAMASGDIGCDEAANFVSVARASGIAMADCADA